MKKIYIKYFIQNKSLIILVNSYFFVFLYSCFSLLLIKENSPKTGSEITVSYISIFSFISLIPLTFNYAYKLIQELNINYIIEEHLQNLEFKTIFRLDSANQVILAEKSIQKNITPNIVDNDSLYLLRQLILNCLKNDKHIEAQLYLDKIFEKFTKYVLDKSEIHKSEKIHFLYYRFTYFLTSIITDTKYNSPLINNLVFDKILKFVDEFYVNYNQAKFRIYHLEPFRTRFYGQLLKIYKDDILKIEEIMKYIKSNIYSVMNFNLPPEASIMFYNSEYREAKNISLEETRKNQPELDKNYKTDWDILKTDYTKYFGSLKIFVELGFPCKNPSSKVLKISHIESKSFDGSQKVVRTFNDTI